jgi:hypothetical protein
MTDCLQLNPKFAVAIGFLPSIHQSPIQQPKPNMPDPYPHATPYMTVSFVPTQIKRRAFRTKRKTKQKPVKEQEPKNLTPDPKPPFNPYCTNTYKLL